MNSELGVRGVALISAIEGRWKSRARSAVSLSFFVSGSYGNVGSTSGGLGVTLNITISASWLKLPRSFPDEEVAAVRRLETRGNGNPVDPKVSRAQPP
ncbi:hypothetical protein D3C87_1535100 [compost metagenome]